MSRALRRPIIAALGLLTMSALLPAPASAQARRPMALEDLLTAVRVGDPQLSPDGRRVLFVRTITDSATGKRNADIWVVPADGSAPPRPFIEGPKTDGSPRFLSNDRVVFASTRDGAAQLYVADGEGKNARAITTLGAGVQEPIVVSPDGRMVAFVSDVYPRCGDEACNARTRDSVEKDPVKVHALTRLPYRHWNEWWEAVRHHVFVTDVESGATRDLTPGDYDSPPHFYEDGAIAFSPDSRQLAFVSKRDGKDSEMWTTNHDVWTVPVSGGAAKKLTANPAADMTPVYSPDGKWLVVRAQRRAGFEADRWYLDAYDRTSGVKHTLFTNPDLSVDDFKFSPDGKTIWFTAVRDGTGNLYTMPAAGGTPKLAAQGGAVGAFQVGNGLAVFARSTLVAPTDLYRLAADGTTRQLTNENAAWLSAVDFPKPASLTVAGAGGTPVQYWLLKPPHFDATKKYPVVFLIHGGPQSSWEDAWSSRWNPTLWAAQGWVVAAPNPRGSTGFGQKFVDEISQDWCGKVMTDLGAVFDTVSALPYVDRARAGIAGASYGGYTVLIALTRMPELWRAGVDLVGVANLKTFMATTSGFIRELFLLEFGDPDKDAAFLDSISPLRDAGHIVDPLFVYAGANDPRVPRAESDQIVQALRARNVPVEYMVAGNEGHSLAHRENQIEFAARVARFLESHLK